MARLSLAALVVAGAVMALAALPGCSSSSSDGASDAPLTIPDGCQPLLADPDLAATTGPCLAPFPSDFHRVADATTLTSFRMGLRGAARPKKANGQDADIHDVLKMDGASLTPTITAALAGDLVHDGLPGVLDDPNKSALATSPTVLLEAATGTLLPHYVDLVDRKEATHTPIMLRPFSQLKPRTRYIVAISGVMLAQPDGTSSSMLAPAPEGFRRLRNGTTTNDPALAAIAPRFDAEIFSPLAKAGVDLDHLQLAWDFTTGSSEEPLADMLHVRELTLAWIAANPPQAKVVATKAGTGNLAQIVTVELTAPLFLDKKDPGGLLHHGADGKVAQNGTATFDVEVVVPTIVRDGTTPAKALAYGHGFFGGTDELEGDGGRAISTKVGAVLFGIDWWGMAKDDLAMVTDTLTTNPEHVADFAERVHQAMANWLVTLAAIRGSMTKLPELQRTTTHDAYWDPSFIGYFGASQGHILGGTLAALGDFSRIILNVGGGGFSHIMPRSLNFGPFAILLGAVFDDPLVVQSYIAMMQRPLDRIDPVSYAENVFAKPLSGAPQDRRILMQAGLGDPQVPNVGTFLHARALGIPQAMPAPFTVFGLKPTADAAAPSSLTLFDFHVDTTGYTEGHPIAANEVHGGVRLNASALTQMESFMKPGGTIVHACDGACDPN